MTDDILLYLIFLIFLTILNIIGYLKIPVLCLMVMLITIIVSFASITAFGDIWIIPVGLCLTNIFVAILALSRAL